MRQLELQNVQRINPDLVQSLVRLHALLQGRFLVPDRDHVLFQVPLALLGLLLLVLVLDRGHVQQERVEVPVAVEVAVKLVIGQQLLGLKSQHLDEVEVEVAAVSDVQAPLLENEVQPHNRLHYM